MAVDYYELDFADKAQRWIMQELVHLAIAEPGGQASQPRLYMTVA
jgi:hypothetical protein